MDTTPSKNVESPNMPHAAPVLCTRRKRTSPRKGPPATSPTAKEPLK